MLLIIGATQGSIPSECKSFLSNDRDLREQMIETKKGRKMKKNNVYKDIQLRRIFKWLPFKTLSNWLKLQRGYFFTHIFTSLLEGTTNQPPLPLF